jgi:hypothetical protein
VIGATGGKAEGKVKVPPALVSAVTDTTLVPDGAERGRGAQAVAVVPLSLVAALDATGRMTAATGTAAAKRIIRGRFMPTMLTWQ